MTWGKIITTKFYLNTNLKPITVGDRINIYPLYVRVICKQQVSQFKYFGKDLEPKLFSKKEYGDFFGKFDLDTIEGIPLQNKALAIGIVAGFKKDVEYILNFLDAFERKDFSIKELPSVLKSYYEIEKDVLRIISSAVIKEMFKRKYDSLVPIIDWTKQNPIWIATTLNSFLDECKLPQIKLNFESLPVMHVWHVLDMIKEAKALSGSRDSIVQTIVSNMNSKNIKGYESLVHDILAKAIDFYRSSTRLLSKR